MPSAPYKNCSTGEVIYGVRNLCGHELSTRPWKNWQNPTSKHISGAEIVSGSGLGEESESHDPAAVIVEAGKSLPMLW